MLNGSLASFALPDVLRFVAASGATGRVVIEREEIAGELSLDQGRFVAARLDDEEAPSTEDEALDVVVLLFDGTDGTFEVVDEEWAGGPLDFDADALIAAVDRRREQWAEVVEVLGSLDDPLLLVADLPEGTDEITITAEQWRLISLVDGTRSAQDIARDAASSVYATSLALAGLAEKGMVAPGLAPVESSKAKSPAVRAVAPTPPPAEDDDDDEDDEDPAELLRELGDPDGDGDDPPKGGKRASVRPLRVPTREEQRVRLRR